jgi:hypothetical protein
MAQSKKMTRRELANLLSGLLDDAERDADAGLVVADDIEVSEATVAYHARETWPSSSPRRGA